MKNTMTIMLINSEGQIWLRDVELPLAQAAANPRIPQFICAIPKGMTAHILGVEGKEDDENQSTL
jgi:hypothetical protein